MKTIKIEFPENLYKGALSLVEDGWFGNEQELITEAVRRFIESHQPELMDQFIREDIEWGLHGQE